MKKNLLFSVALAAAATAIAATPAFTEARQGGFVIGPKAPATEQAAQPATRADEGLETFDFSYAGYPYAALNYPSLPSTVTRIYMCFQMQSEDIRTFKGSKVTGFTVYSPTNYEGTENIITEGKFFYSTDPDLLKADYSEDFSFSKTPYAANKVELKQPYTITGEEPALYFGYSLVPDATMYIIPYDGEPNFTNSGLAGVAQNDEEFPPTFDAFGDYYGALAMSVTLEGHDFPRSMTIDNLQATLCLPIGKPAAFPIGIKATSGSPISSFEIEYTLGGKKYESTYSYEMPIPAGMNQYMGAQLEIPAQNEKLIEDVTFIISKINGVPVTGEVEGATAKVRVVDEVPVHQTLMEEYTGTWCQFCPMGYAALEYLRKNHPEFVVASYHSGNGASQPDPMEVTQDFPVYVSQFPSATLNRTYNVDPHDGTATYDELPLPIVGDIESLNAIPTSWSVKVSHTWESDSLLTARAEVANIVGFENREYKIAYILVADGLWGTSRSWAQVNAFYTQTANPLFIDELKAFFRGGDYGKALVPRLVYNDVVISAEGIHGVEGSIPASLEAEQKAEHSLTFDLSEIPSYLIADKNKLRVIAAVVDPYGNVLNCAKDEVNDYVDAAVDGIFDADAPAEYYNLNGVKIDRPTEGVFIRRQGGKTSKILVR